MAIDDGVPGIPAKIAVINPPDIPPIYKAMSKIMAVLSYKLFKDHGITASPEELLSVFKNKGCKYL